MSQEMKILFAGVAFAARMSMGAVCSWNPQGSGGWADDARWVPRAPATGDTVDFCGCTGLVTKADSAVLAHVASVTLTGPGSGLVISNTVADGDFEFPVPVSGDGVLIKQGDGVVRMTCTETATKTGFWMRRGLEVLDGTLYLPRAPKIDLWLWRVTVMEPGVFVHTGTSYTRVQEGLWGTGTVSNDTSKPLYLGGGTPESPAVFSGRFVNQAYPCLQNFTATNKVQYFTGTNSSNAKTPLHYSTDGTLGLQKIGSGTKSSDPSSAGSCNVGIYFRGLRNRLLYLGTGENVLRTISFGTGACDVELDAGAQGGLNLNGALTIQPDECNVMNALTLSGCGENVFNATYATVTNPAGRPVAHYLTKAGTGSWRFTDGKTRSAIGTVDVRKGTLRFDSIAERGTDCALGPANLTHTKYYAVYNSKNPGLFDIDDSKALPYAIRLGNGTDAVDDEHLATLDYSGTVSANIGTRVIAVIGAGRLRTSSAALGWRGVTAADTGRHTLALESTDYPVSVVVTNGPGVLDIVKEGNGGALISAGSRLTGSLAVRGGTLSVNGPAYAWYRLTVDETWNNATNSTGEKVPGGGGSLTLCQFALRDANGENQVLNIPHNKAADARPWLLEPGQAAIGVSNYRILGTDDFGRNVTWALSNLFSNAGTVTGVVRYDTVAKRDLQYNGVNTPPTNRISIVVRLPADAHPVTSYDLRCQGYWPKDDSSCLRMPRAWRVEGSADGVLWDTLSELTTNDNTYANIPTTETLRWYSSNSRTVGPGYALGATESSEDTILQLSGVSVAAGARFDARGGSATAAGLDYDCTAEGGGEIAGVTFAADAVVRLTGFQDNRLGCLLPLTLSGCRGLSSRSWQVQIDGETRSDYYARVGADGVRVLRHGFVILVR